jgi:hypothetical protein
MVAGGVWLLYFKTSFFFKKKKNKNKNMLVPSQEYQKRIKSTTE